jgi:hypothetical protein
MRGIAIIDGPDSDDAAAKTYAGDVSNPRAYLVDPWVKVQVGAAVEVHPSSARVAGVIAKSDNERGFWWSPSNRPISGILGTARAIDFTLGDATARANLLNEGKVSTIIRKDGYRLWGNRSTSGDAKWSFISVRRTADIINDSLLRAHMWAVDRNITKTYLSDVLEGVNSFLGTLRAQGAIINGKAWADPDLNSASEISQGKVYIDFDFTPPYPAEHITFRSQLTNEYLTEVLP